MIKAIIVDDEETSREVFRRLAGKHSDKLIIMEEASSAGQAYELIRQKQPDLVFLDVEMPHESGFDLLEKFDEIGFGIVFTTAFSQYALKAIKFSALDYLLKPIDETEFVKTIEKAEQHKRNNYTIKPGIATLLSNLRNSNRQERLALPSSDGLIIVELDKIISCTASSNYTMFRLSNGNEIVATRTLKEYEDILPEDDFFRLHKSTIVNMRFVEKYVKGEGGYVIMKDKSTYEVSRRKKNEFLQKLL
jgi:two-component system, LytTR family, response regulator